MKLTDKSRELLESKIYETLMSNPENGLGEMGDCRDEAKRIVDEWIEEEDGIEHPIVSFLNAYILVWDEFNNSPAYTEYFGGTLTKMLQFYCLAHNLPMNASADDLLADIKANNITLDDEICNG